MGATTSSIFSEIYLQYTENTKICEILVRHKIEDTLDMSMIFFWCTNKIKPLYRKCLITSTT